MSRNQPAIFDAEDPASPLSVTAAETAVLLMDYHHFLIWREEEQAVAAMVKANIMRDWALANGALVVHCLVDVKQSMPRSFKSATRFTHNMADVMEAQPNNAADEHPDIAIRAGSGEHLVKRTPGHISALNSQTLRSLLITRGIKSLVLCGISTSGCVLSTARAAGDDEYIVTVIEDACMDPISGLHDALIYKVLPVQAHVATAAGFQEQWDRAKDGRPVVCV